MTSLIDKQRLLDYLVLNNGKPQGKTWSDLAKEFNIYPTGLVPHHRGRAANDIWRGYCRSVGQTYRLLEPVMEKLNSQGEVTSTTLKVVPDTIDVNTNEFEINKITKNPYGGQWITYNKKESVFDTEGFLNEIRNIIQTTEVYTPQIEKLKTPLKEALFVYVADKHVGAKTETNSLYPNQYNKEVITQRNNILLDFITEEAVLHEGFEDIFIFDLGDSQDGMDGKTTRGTSLNQNMNTREQHLTYFETQKQFFDTLLRNIKPANNYHFIACANNNHSGDFDFISMNAVKIYLNHVYPNVNVVLVEEFMSHFIYGEHCIIFTHGKDREYMKHGMPLFLDGKTTEVIDTYIRHHRLEDYVISFVKADLHQCATTYAKNNRIRYKNVMSFYGASDYIQTVFASNLSGVDIDIIRKNENRIYETKLQFPNG